MSTFQQKYFWSTGVDQCWLIQQNVWKTRFWKSYMSYKCPWGVWRRICYLLNIWGFGGWYDTFWPPKSIGLHGTSSLRNWRIKNFYQDLCIFLHVKNDVSSWKVKKCSRNDKITSGTDLESWDTILLVKATLVNTCWQVLTSWCYQNVWKSRFWAKLAFFQSHIVD